MQARDANEQATQAQARNAEAMREGQARADAQKAEADAARAQAQAQAQVEPERSEGKEQAESAKRGGVGTQLPGKWVLAAPGCQVWDANPAPIAESETVKWSGKCVSGKASGPGTGEWFLKGQLAERAEGNLVAGMLTGKVRIEEFRQGHSTGVYEGPLVAGHKLGEGTFTYADGTTYVGHFTHDTFDGEGTVTYPDGQRHHGVFANGERHGLFTQTYPDGTQVQGQYVHDAPSAELREQIARRHREQGAARVQAERDAANAAVRRVLEAPITPSSRGSGAAPAGHVVQNFSGMVECTSSSRFPHHYNLQVPRGVVVTVRAEAGAPLRCFISLQPVGNNYAVIDSSEGNVCEVRVKSPLAVEIDYSVGVKSPSDCGATISGAVPFKASVLVPSGE
jgi:hypothetical protein